MTSVSSVAGPRIYNLFPLLAGAAADWPAHLPRIAGMGFDWIFVNPFHYPGFSGSLYAIKDPDRLHPVVQGDSDEAPDVLIGRFLAAAHKHGIKVMADLVVNHTAKDALLVEAHPDWFRRDSDGGLRSPRAVDPVDPRIETVWGDLAEIDYDRPEHRRAQVDYWRGRVRRYLDLGFRGFRCDAAYQVPSDLWAPLIAAARDADPDVLFCAETLGCTMAQAEALEAAGFDLMFNSAKWWDFRDDWLLDQYERFRRIAPTISFPESHDTERLATELGIGDAADLKRHYRQRYLFAAGFATGVMMPMGYEYGFGKRLDVVTTRPGDWAWEAESPRFDLTGYIAAVNAMKATTPALNVEGPAARITAPDNPVVGLLRVAGAEPRTSDEAAILLIHRHGGGSEGVDPGPLLAETGGRLDRFDDVTPDAEPMPFTPGHPVTLGPLEARLFRGRAGKAAAKAPSKAESKRRLESLARDRIAIEDVYPELDGGRHAVKRVVGDVLEVWADVFGDGHEKIAAAVQYKEFGERSWREVPMAFFDNDRWVGRVPLTRNARYLYTVVAWRDLFETWRGDLMKKVDAGQNVALELIEGRHLVEKAAAGAKGEDRKAMDGILAALAGDESAAGDGERLSTMLSEELRALMARNAERSNLSRYWRDLEVVVDRPAARFAAWYEMFPRSQSGDPDRHGTFEDVIRRLPYVRDMGFDVLYFTPIHPIGRINRKGRNNTLTPGPDDPGSPYAIGAAEGGHDALHPELGSFDDFRRLVQEAHRHGLEIAIDFAIQCSPDHPWLKEHPEWFDWRPDGTIKYAENPPKKYEDIVNVHFYRDALPDLWYALRDIVLFWVGHGVKTFRVDNPHTKPLPFWEWMIREVQDRHPDTIFLAEAFTRPKMMKRLGKIGYTQSYTYFTWRNEKQELIEYLTELTTEAKDYYRPNFFVNTPDINPEILQTSHRPAYQMRAALAATLSGVYGVYNGFELCEGTPYPGKEEYLDSEKYEIKAWDWDRPGHIRDYITRLNRIRRDNPALHDHLNLRFLNAWNDQVLVYFKMSPARDNVIVVAVNLDPHNPQGANFEVPLWEFGLPDDATVAAEELLTGENLSWTGKVQHVWLDPAVSPCAIWRMTPPGL
ncbi:MAG: alpha-amylase [Rhodospirillaceae bacterium]|mgnify:CR=1 FL=1|nr:alpha-amylase [Rhodospirillaceae bacterium]